MSGWSSPKLLIWKKGQEKNFNNRFVVRVMLHTYTLMVFPSLFQAWVPVPVHVTYENTDHSLLGTHADTV